MFKKISAKNYRSFSSISLEPLSRINVITGMNACGKTSILEIPFLIAGGPNARLALSLYNFRSESTLVPGLERPFRVLFHDLEFAVPIELESTGSFVDDADSHRSLKISSILSLNAVSGSPIGEQKLSGLQFDFTGPSGKLTGRVEWQVAESQQTEGKSVERSVGLSVEVPACEDQINGYFASPYFREIWNQTHKLLTELVKTNQMSDVIDNLMIIEPRIRNLLPLSELEVLSIYADIGGKSLMPVSQMGSGFANILHLVVDGTMLRNGIILIDEIEDGLHYSITAKLMNFLFEISVKNNIQFFITTHSDEVLRTFAETAQSCNFNELALFRISGRNGKSMSHYFSAQEIFDISELDAELR